jgi:alkylation response protein AidB-like acyl-CoA dehydrogenase
VQRIPKAGDLMSMSAAVTDTDDQRTLIEAVEGVFSRHWPNEAVRDSVDAPSPSSEVPLWSRLAELGIAGLPVPEDLGGAGGGWSDLAVAAEACGSVVAAVPVVAVSGALGALRSVSGDATAALIRRICAEATIATVAWTPGEGRWGATGRFTTESAPVGKTASVSGRVDLLLSPEAEVIIVLAESPDDDVLLAVPARGPGVEIERLEGLDLLRPLGALTLASAEATVLATGGEALSAIRRSLVTAGAALASELVGTAAHCLRAAVAYAGDRHQFGRPIGSFQAIKHKCADMLTGVETARAAARHVAGLLDRAEPAETAGALEGQLDEAVALALLEAFRVGQKVTADYIQVLGGIGFTWEHEAHLYYRRAGAAQALFGGVEAQLERLNPFRHGRKAAAPSATAYPEGTPAREFALLVEEILPKHQAKWGEDDSFAARLDWQRTLHSVGWIAPHWPVSFGGRGLGISDQVACDQVLAEYRAPALAGVLGVNNVAPTLMRFGTPEQQEHLLGIQSGTEVWCQGFSEPGAGSDLASLRTRAVLDGDEFVINGQKIWTSEGMEGTHCLLLVRTDPDAPAHRGISALLVPLDLPGITRRPITQMTGEGGFAELFFDDVRVPRNALLGKLNDGWNVTMTTLGFERAGVIMMAGRLERSVLDVVTELTGRDLTPSVRHALTERLAEARLLGLLGMRALGRIAVGGAPGAEHSVIKLACSMAMQALGATYLSALGTEAAAAASGAAARQEYLYSPAIGIAGGTTEIMRNILAERVLGLPR